MLLKKARIKNYKSIIDSGDIYFEQDLTILAGKNESGKSSILEALQDFNPGRKISEDARSIIDIDAEPEITITFEVGPEDVEEYFNSVFLENPLVKPIEISIKKDDSFEVSDEIAEMFKLNDNSFDEAIQGYKEGIKRHYEELKKMLKSYLVDSQTELFKIDFANLEDYAENSLESIKEWKDENESDIANFLEDDLISKLENLLEELIANHQELIERIDAGKNDNWDAFLNLIPNFIMFRSFEDILPNEVSFKDLKNNEFIKDLTIISNLDTNIILNTDKRLKETHKKELNISFNNDYKKYWVQDLTSINITWDSDTLSFWIEENNVPYKPHERSKGKQWHMSFYIKVTARALEKKNNIILIDEPGLFLHASAQRDIYNKLVERSKVSQVIFSTHSPYLLNKDELFRIRLINRLDNNLGTKAYNKIHAASDKETLTPIMTTIGLELNQAIHETDKNYNVVVEGPSDYFYLTAFKVLLKRFKLNIIFGGGAGNMGNVGTILTGWGCKVIYLYDNDKGKKDGSKNLIKNWLVEKDLITQVRKDSGSIEDLFDKKDFFEQVLEKEEERSIVSISQFLKESRTDKVLVSKLFNAKVAKNAELIKLSSDTVKNFEELLLNLEKAFI